MKAGDDDLQRSDAGPSLSGPTHTSELMAGASLRPALASDAQRASPDTRRDPTRYELIGEHGRGGLGRVSRVRDRELGRDVAIKELLARSTVDELRFRREVLITARLEHPGIVPLYEAGRWPDGTPFYAMKLVSGRPLRELIAERQTVEQRIGLLHHVIAVADAIAYAHGRNIIHRDLKPANVIVGDFGETIVIDWGLAKDLTSGDDLSLARSAPAASPPGDLTSTGCVLGTPAYMAPEQQRGEHVDQRADVFAIGTMLWELCSLQKVPPTRVRTRHRLLRRAGIDNDLIAIIDKALDPIAARRYPDAGALAADLKAFKSGARITARSYSLLAMLAHWTRRHRALALSATAAVAIAATASALYVRGIAAERDRADSSEEVATRARASAEASRDELVLNVARLLLTTDPSAALDALARYDGPDGERAAQIRADAMGRGVALVRALPHTDNVLWAQGSDAGIYSLSTDGTIARTSRDGTSVVVTRGVSRSARTSYSPVRQLLAYTCDPSDLCLFDLRAARATGASILRNANVSGMSFSPDGRLLAILSNEVGLQILDVSDAARPALRFATAFQGGVDIEFASDRLVAAATTDGIDVIDLNGGSKRFSLPGISRWDVDVSEHELALATTTGQALVLASSPLRVVARIDLCHGPVAGLRFIPGRRSVAYACRAGAMGIWDVQQGTVSARAQLEGHADLIATSPTGEYVVAAGGHGGIAILDLSTNLVASYRGHGIRLTSLAPPTPAYPFLVSADAQGHVRLWSPPARFAQVAAISSSPFLSAVFDDRAAIVSATTRLPVLTTFSPATGVRTAGPHEPDNIFLVRSRNGRTFATYGLQGDLVEVWSFSTMTRTRVIATGHGSVSQLHFVGDTDDVMTAGNDGRLVRWMTSGSHTVLAQLTEPIDKIAMTRATDSIVLSTIQGALWRIDASGQLVFLRTGGSRVTRLLALADQETIHAGHANGEVIALDTRSWQHRTILRGAGAVREIAVTNDGHAIAVATNDGAIHVGTRHDDASRRDETTWKTLAAHARHITLAPDGLLVASCTDGTIWLYASSRQRWLSLPTGAMNLGRNVVTADGKAAVVLDFEGRLLWIDLEAARKLMSR
jgi:WD40 repeat protein